METIKLQTVVDADGILKLQLPLELADQEVEVLVVVQPTAPIKRVWPSGYAEQSTSTLSDDPIERPPQSEYENRKTFRG